MARENQYLDNYVLWCYLILIISNTIMNVIGNGESVFNYAIQLVIYGGIFWYWYQDKDYKIKYLIFASFTEFICRCIIAIVFVFMLPNSYDFENITVIAIIKFMSGIIFSFTEAYFYQLFKIKSYRNENNKQREQ